MWQSRILFLSITSVLTTVIEHSPWTCVPTICLDIMCTIIKCETHPEKSITIRFFKWGRVLNYKTAREGKGQKTVDSS